MGRPLKEFLQIGGDEQRNKQNMSSFVLSSLYFFSSLFLCFYSLFFLSSLFFPVCLFLPWLWLSSFTSWLIALLFTLSQVLIAYYLPSWSICSPRSLTIPCFTFQLTAAVVAMNIMTQKAFSNWEWRWMLMWLNALLGLSTLSLVTNVIFFHRFQPSLSSADRSQNY